MSYFSNFPLTYYKVGDSTELVTDILRRSSFAGNIKNLLGAYTEYDVISGERPESVAQKFYSSPFLHWVVLLFNEIHSPYFQWPLNQVELDQYCIDVYGDNLYSVHHYERDGFTIGESKEYDKEALNYVWVPPANPGPQDLSVTAVTHYEVEERANEERRKIKLLRIELLPEFIKQFGSSINV